MYTDTKGIMKKTHSHNVIQWHVDLSVMGRPLYVNKIKLLITM